MTAGSQGRRRGAPYQGGIEAGHVRLLAVAENNLFVVGDHDQTIYAWRLADVKRVGLHATVGGRGA